jgi:hypothetical protein
MLAPPWSDTDLNKKLISSATENRDRSLCFCEESHPSQELRRRNQIKTKFVKTQTDIASTLRLSFIALIAWLEGHLEDQKKMVVFRCRRKENAKRGTSVKHGVQNR